MSEWQKVKIGDVCTITKGAIGIKKAVAGEYPMVTLAEKRTTHNEFQFDCEAVIIPLVSSTGHGHASMKRVHYQEGKFAIGSILCAVVPNDTEFLNPKYLHIYLSYLKDKLLVPLMRGAANVSLSISNIKTVEVIVPPIERQLEIIELEKVLRNQKGKLDEQNSFQQSHLTLLRQQILQDAISGKLTADWRAENPDIEPASKLLEQIKDEKEKLIAEKKIKKEKALPLISEDEVPFELPEGWEWCRLGEILEILLGGYSYKSYAFKKEGKNQVLRLGNIRPDYLRLEEKGVFIDDELAYSTTGFELKTNDILITMTGTRGKRDYCYTVMISDDDLANRRLFLNQRVGCFRFMPQIIGGFLNLALKNDLLLNQIYKTATGSANQANIGATALKNWIIPLPPRAEQRAIVAKVERLMGYVSQLEEKIAQNANSAETLMQAFLGEVFRK